MTMHRSHRVFSATGDVSQISHVIISGMVLGDWCTKGSHIIYNHPHREVECMQHNSASLSVACIVIVYIC